MSRRPTSTVRLWTAERITPRATGFYGVHRWQKTDEEAQALIAPVAHYLETTATRVPFSDWYETVTGEYCHFMGEKRTGRYLHAGSDEEIRSVNPCSIPDCFKFISFLNPMRGCRTLVRQPILIV